MRLRAAVTGTQLVGGEGADRRRASGEARDAADLTQVRHVADTLKRTARGPAVVVMKSTVPVGTCDGIQRGLDGARVHLEVASNPEFTKEGDAVADFFHPDRIVVGVRSAEAEETLRRLYAPLRLPEGRVVVTDPCSSELIKHASNACLAMRVSFMNELSRLCHASGANVHAVRIGVGGDTRIGPRFLYAGPGYGGSCFPKDVQALLHVGRSHGVPMRLAEATHLANEEQGEFVFELLQDAVGVLAGKTIALWGLAFKPETDDVRESPALKLARRLLAEGARVVGHDPEAGESFRRALPCGAAIAASEYEALDEADALVLLTEWRSYRAPRFEEVRARLRPGRDGYPVVLDARNVWDPGDVAAAGIRYVGVGVPGRPPAGTAARDAA